MNRRIEDEMPCREEIILTAIYIGFIVAVAVAIMAWMQS